MLREIGMICENMDKTTVIMLSKAKQSKAKQSNNCLLNNNFKFYIFQFLNAFKFLSVSILLQITRGSYPLCAFISGNHNF